MRSSEAVGGWMGPLVITTYSTSLPPFGFTGAKKTRVRYSWYLHVATKKVAGLDFQVRDERHFQCRDRAPPRFARSAV